MRLRKGALNAYGSLDGPMLDDDVELEVGEDVKLQMLMKLIKDVFFNGYDIPSLKLPEHGWLEYYFLIGIANFQVLCQF